MPVGVGYSYQPRGAIDLAGVNQRQQQINLQKQQLQQEQMWKVIDAVTEAYKEQEKIKKFKEMVSKADKEGYGLPTLSTNAAGEVSATYKPKTQADLATEEKAIQTIADIKTGQQFQQTAGDVMGGLLQQPVSGDVTRLLPQIPTGRPQRPLTQRVPPRLRERVGIAEQERARRTRAEQMRTQLAQSGRILSPTGKGWKPEKPGFKSTSDPLYSKAITEASKQLQKNADYIMASATDSDAADSMLVDKANRLYEEFKAKRTTVKPKPKYKIGTIITKGNKRYKVVGFDTDGEPLVDLVR